MKGKAAQDLSPTVNMMERPVRLDEYPRVLVFRQSLSRGEPLLLSGGHHLRALLAGLGEQFPPECPNI